MIPTQASCARIRPIRTCGSRCSHNGELVCFSVTHIHNTDVGGAVPASLSRTLTEVHQEGVRLPPVKLFKRGELNREVRDIMLANVRMPEQNWGDMKAQVACVNTGDRKVHEMIARFGIDTFRHGIVDLLDHGEAQARRVIREIPDGDYFFADYTDEDFSRRASVPDRAQPDRQGR